LEKLQLANGFVKKELFLLSKNNCMNRIILIGNGFDLAHGLKTSYKHFIDWFWEKEINKIKLEYVTSSDKSQYDGKYFSIVSHHDITSQIINNVNYNQLLEFIIDYNKGRGNIMLNISFKNKFLQTISTSLKNWVDIEEEYYTQLKKIIQKEYSAVIEKNEEMRGNAVKKLNGDFAQIKDELKEYLIKQSKNVLKHKQEIEDFTYENSKRKDFTIKGFDKLVEEKYYDYFSYGSNERKEENRKDAIEYCKREILNDKMNLLPPQQYLFLNFNYTNTSHKYSKNNEIIHIHGELENLENPMIFGYGDELDENYKKIERLNDDEFLKNVKSINYLKTDNYKRLLNFIETDCYQIFIMGHSCGNSDRTLLNTLFEHSNCISIKPFYYEQNGVNDHEKIIMSISRNFNDKKAFREKVVNEKDCVALPQAKKL